MNNIIVISFPNYTLFNLISLTIAYALIPENKKCVLAFSQLPPPNKLSAVLNLDGIILVNIRDLNSLLENMGDISVEYIAWYHTQGIDSTIRAVNEMALIKNIKSIKISYSPDGFSNIVRSLDIHSAYSSILSLEKTSIGKFYFLFGVNKISKSCIKSIEIAIIDSFYYKKAIDLLRASDELFTELGFENQLINLSREKTIIFIPIRPWCTEFHGGKYNFGKGAPTLANIYINLIKEILNIINGEYLIVLKADDRFYETQQEAISLIKDFFYGSVINLSNKINPKLTSEVYALFLSKYCKTGYVISLDSSAPLAISALGLNWYYAIGCSNSYLLSIGATPVNLRYIKLLLDRVMSNIESFLAVELIISNDGFILFEANKPRLI